MTRNELARELCMEEGGVKQTNIAQVNELLKLLSRKLKGPACAMVLKALLASLVLVTLSGCALLEREKLEILQDKIELAVASLGAGDWKVSGTLSKDGTAYGSAEISWTCRKGADGKMAGCSEPVVAFQPLK